MKLIQSVAPSVEPLTLAEMKTFLRVLHDDDNELITSYITAAREKAESIMNRQIILATYELYFDVLPSEFKLPRPPFVALDSFQVFDGTAWNDIEYDLDDKNTPAILHVTTWPLVSSNRNSIKVVYQAGYEDATKVPESIKAWIRIEVEMMYDEEKPRINVDAFLSSYRVIPV